MMTGDFSLWAYFANASWVVQGVMLVLLAASVISWAVIFQRRSFLRKIARLSSRFENQFWSRAASLSDLYTHHQQTEQEQGSLANIFAAGFSEFIKSANPNIFTTRLDSVQRAMRAAHTREVNRLTKHLSLLASVGSTSPYIGLFGTVWGIMTAFHALGSVQQASIAMVAPGISEALIATAMGLFAAIPAVLAYNRYTQQVQQLDDQLQSFQAEFMNILQRQSNMDASA
jgi:biopolymer transport protein TolQ